MIICKSNILPQRLLALPGTTKQGLASLSPASKSAVRIFRLKAERGHQARRTFLILNPDGPLLRRRQQAEAVTSSDGEVEARLACLASILRQNELIDIGPSVRSEQERPAVAVPSDPYLSMQAEDGKEHVAVSNTTDAEPDLAVGASGKDRVAGRRTPSQPLSASESQAHDQAEDSRRLSAKALASSEGDRTDGPVLIHEAPSVRSEPVNRAKHQFFTGSPIADLSEPSSGGSQSKDDSGGSMFLQSR